MTPSKKQRVHARLPGLLAAGLLALPLAAAEPVTWLGVSVQPPDEVVRHQLKLPRGAGLTVTQIAEASPAEAKLRRHDILLRLDDQWLFNAPQLASLVQSHAAGDAVNLTLLREGGETSIQVELGEHEKTTDASGVSLFPGQPELGWQPMEQWIKALRPPTPPAAPPIPAPPDAKPRAFLGVEVQKPEASVLAQLGRDAEVGGVLIGFVVDESPAGKAGLRQYDLITMMDGQPVKSPESFIETVRSHQPGDKVTVGFLRAGQTQDLEVTLGKAPPAPPTPSVPKPMPMFRFGPDTGGLEWRHLPGASAGTAVVLPSQSNEEVIVLQGEAGDPFAGGGTGAVAFGATGAWSGEGTEKGVSSVGPKGNPPQLRTRIITRSTGSSPGPQPRLGTVLLRDEHGEMTVKQENEVRHIEIKSPAGEVVFQGDLDEALKAEDLAPERRARLEQAKELLEQQIQTETQLQSPPAPARQIRELRLIKPPTPPGFIRWERQDDTSGSASPTRV